MAWTSNDSAIRVTPELSKMLETASPEEMKSLFRDAAISQGLATADIFNPDVLHETELASAAPKRFARSVSVDGTKHVIEGGSPEELQQNEIQFYKDIHSQPQEQTRDDKGRFTAETRTEQPTVDDAAVESYLRTRGINPDALREASDARYVANWQAVSEQFMARHPEWAGGENRDRLAEVVMELHLEDTPTVDALETAYAELRRRNAYIELTPEVHAVRSEREIGTAQTVEEIRELGRRSLGIPTSSGVFGGG